MKKVKNNMTKRILAMVMVFLIVLGTLPLPTLTLAADSGKNVAVNITVTDGEDTPVQNATVEYALDTEQPDEEAASWETVGELTNEEGKLTVLDENEKDVAEGIMLWIKVSCDGYTTLVQSVDIYEKSQLSEACEVEITLTEENQMPNELHTVSVSVSGGNASVLIGNQNVVLNGEGEGQVEVAALELVAYTITPGENCYIKDVKINSVSIDSAKIPEKGQALTTETIDVSQDDVTITVELGTCYTVSVTQSTIGGEGNAPGGTITLDGASVNSIVVDTAETVTLNVEAADGYIISGIKINGIDEEIQDDDSFEKELNEASDVVVVFTKVYTVTIIYDSEKGGVVTDPGYNGTVLGGITTTVVMGEAVKIIATPNPGFRVEAVTVNDDAKDDVTKENSSGYELTVNADKDYTVEVIFAYNQYTVAVEDTENGTVSVDNDGAVESGSNPTVTITPDDGYTIESIIVKNADDTETPIDFGDVEVGDDGAGYADGTYRFEINNIIENKTVVVTFKKANITDAFTFEYENVWREISDRFFVVKENGAIVFNTEEDGIRVFVKGETGVKLVGGNDSTQSVEVEVDDGLTEVVKVQVYYQPDGELPAWYDSTSVSNEYPIKMIVDDTPPDITYTVEGTASDVYGYYKDDVTITVTVNENEYYSGIDKITYFITKEQLSEGTTYDEAFSGMEVSLYDSQEDLSGEIKNEITCNPFVVVANDNNSQFTKVWIKVVDRAGKVSEKVISLPINTVPPTIELSIDGDKNANIDGAYYVTDRVLTITVTDINDSFIPGNLNFSYMKNGQSVEVNGADISWSSEGDVHVGTYTFSGDGKYTFDEEDVTYTNKANSTNEDVTVDVLCEDLNSFVIDNTAPLVDDITITYPDENRYYNDYVNVAIVSKDSVSGVKEIRWKYVKTVGASDVNKESDDDFTSIICDLAENECSKTITLPKVYDPQTDSYKQLNGYLVVEVVDWAGNVSNWKVDEEQVVVVDNKLPIGSVDYTSPIDIIGSQKYYNGNIDFVFNIEEANFFASDVKVFVSKDGAEKVQISAEQIQWTSLGDDEYTGTYSISGDGDYVLYMEYTDKSGNEMVPYQSDILTIDTTAPIVKIEFDKDSQKIIYTITEHNFRPQDITITGNIVIVEEDASGNLKVYTTDELQDELRSLDISEWQKDGDVYTYASDGYLEGFYELNLDYKDISENSAVTATSGKFCTDYTAPMNVEITYSESLFEKVLEAITFGFYKSSVTVTFTAYDDGAGVDYFTWNYIKQNGASTVNRDTDVTDSKVIAVQDTNDTTKYTATVTLPNTDAVQLRGYLAVVATDKYGNLSEKITDAGNVIVVDSIAPTIKVEYSIADKVVGDTSYYNNDIEVTFKITEANFYKEEVKVMVSKDGGTAYAVTPQWTDESADMHVGKYVLSGDGDYVITVNYTDYSTNKMEEYTSNVLTVDTIAPVVDVKYASTTPINTLVDGKGMQRKYFANKQTATITVKEHNFDANGVVLDIKTEDVAGKALTATGLYEVSEWKAGSEADTYVLEIIYLGDANYTFDISCADFATNESAEYTPDYFTVDRTAPTGLSVSYSTSVLETILETITFGFYNAKVDVTIVAEDTISGVNGFAYSYLKANGVSEVNTELLNQAIAAANITYSNDGKTATAKFQITKDVLSSTTQFNGTVAFEAINRSGLNTNFEDDKRIVVDTIAPTLEVTYNEPVSNANGIAYYDGDVEFVFNIEEANFFAGDVKVFVSKDGANKVQVPVNQIQWTSLGEDKYTATYTISGDGDYVLYVEYTDKSSNEMIPYQTGSLTIDTTDPVVKIEFDEANQKIIYTVTEHNFRPQDIAITGSIVVTEKDASGKLKVYTAEDMQEELRKLHINAWKKNGDVYTYESDDYVEGFYDLSFDYEDISKNSAVTATTGKFYIDYTAPVDIEISYSESLFEKVLETITFGFYKSSVTVTFTAYDDRAGVDYFTWNYIKQNGASTVNRDTDMVDSKVVAVQDANDKTKYTATVTLPNTDAAQLRGYLAVAATDKYGNSSEKVTDVGKVVVVDSIAPTMKVEYTAADKVVGDTSYYNNNVEVTFIVTEANFYKEEVKVMVSKDGGAAYAVTPQWTDESADTHIGKYVLSGDGDYVITVNYTDYSTNKMVEYTSKVLTIDTVVPVINVKYANTTPSTTLADVNGMQREYFANKQTATITIIEHNFDASSVVLDIKAEDVAGKAINTTGLYEVSEWKAGSEVDTHVLEITYFGDANYTFDISNTDLATNKTADYTPDYFTVDKSAPTGLSVSYSTSVLETILETITFGFYNAKVDVTIVAEDTISGVNSFAYSYLKANGVSDVNTEALNEAIAAANITYSNDGKTATAKFQITKDVLSNTTQFNGTIAFDAINRSGLNTNFEDDKRIIVDNIAPTAEVTYNEPVSNENGIAYYDRSIVATVVITEANFYEGDVVITVVKDDVAYEVTPSWTSSSANLHTGTFTLSEDGDYVITINYRDKSSNEMTEYQSGQLTVDTDIQEPTITFNGNNETGHAYKNEIVPEISFSDINYDSYEVFLYRTYMNAINVDITADKGIKELFTINEESGSASLNIFAADGNGKYDQSDDGIYRLVVKMTDKAGHVSEKEAVFTVNRYGSVYAFDEYLVELIADGGAYVKTVTEDLVITEFNADQLVTDSLNIEITKDGKPLEDVKFTTSPTINESVAVGESGWYQYEYVINKDNFVKDGIYKISISSKDATGNTPENSNYEGQTIVFHVDNTAPGITSIVGLEEAVYDATEQKVSYVVFDAMGLKSIKIYLDGEILEEITDFTADLNSYSGSFVIPEKETARTIRLVVEDLAGNITDTDGEDFTSAYEFNSTVTVTTDDWARFVANKPLFYGSIAGTTGLAAAAGFGIRFRFFRRVK